MDTTARLRSAYRRVLRALHTLLCEHTALQTAAQGALAAAAALIVSCAALFDRPLPLALALLAAPEFGAAAVGAFFGAAAGYLLFWGLSSALDMLAGGFLILAGSCIFTGLLPRDRRWFVPVCACTLYALPALVCLLGGRVTAFELAFFPARLALLLLCTAALNDPPERSARSRCTLLLCLLAGLDRIQLPGGISPGVCVTAGLCFTLANEPQGLFCAAAGGLLLDICGRSHDPGSAMLLFPALVCQAMKPEKRALRAAVYLLCAAAALLYTGSAAASQFVSVLLGVLIAAVFVPGQTAGKLDAPENGSKQQKLERIAQVLDTVTRILERDEDGAAAPQSAAVFDAAAERVCRSCGKYGVCWNECAHDTYLALSGASERLLRRGCAVREDFPPYFLARCHRVGAFVSAVNEALDERLCRLQYQARLKESRTLLAEHYRNLARTLRELDTCEPPTRAAFSPEMGFRARGVRGERVCGDYGCCFRCGEWYYVLLCDGMGTGQQAANESRSAAGLLRSMIESGFDALGALQMLNGVYILRQSGCFSTVDLLQVNLVTGEGFLHKWGAAPSYLLQDGALIKIGTASPPPGLGAGEAHQTECVKLSLQREQTLILVSDGAAGEQTEAYVSRCHAQPARELAAGILAHADLTQQDDQSALVLRLHRRTVCKKHSTGRRKILSKPHI